MCWTALRQLSSLQHYLAGDLLGRAIALQVPADKPQQAPQKYDFAFDKVFAPAAGQVSHSWWSTKLHAEIVTLMHVSALLSVAHPA